MATKIDVLALAKEAGLNVDDQISENQVKLFAMLVMRGAAEIARDTSAAHLQGDDPWGMKGAQKSARQEAGNDIIYAVTML